VAHDVKPLSKTECDAAVQIVKRDRRLKPLLAARYRAVLIEPNLHDPKRPGGEDVVVGLVDYDEGGSIVALVDLDTKKVVGVEQTDAQFQLSDDERREAEDLAGKDARVRRFVGRRRMNPLTRLYFPAHVPAAKSSHRHAIVFLRPTTSERRYAVVDLSDRKVVGVLDALVK
jgi:Cu2+-containing amine oxidase